MFVWNDTSFVAVSGYIQKEYSETFVLKGSQLFILQPYNNIVIYNFTDEANVKLVSTINKWRDNNLSPVDFKFVN